MIPHIETENTYTYNIGTLWAIINLMAEEEDERGNRIDEKYKEELEEIANGKFIKIPIEYMINPWVKMYPQRKSVKIMGYGSRNIIMFCKEKDYREKLMREIIIKEQTRTEKRIPRN